MSYWLCGIGTAEDSSQSDDGRFTAWCPETPSGKNLRSLFGKRIDDFELDNAHREDWLNRDTPGGKDNKPKPEEGRALIERILQNAKREAKVALFGTEYYEAVLPAAFPSNSKKFRLVGKGGRFQTNRWFMVHDNISRLTHRVGMFSHPRYWPKADDSMSSEQYRKYLVEVKRHNCKELVFRLASLFDDLALFQEKLIVMDVDPIAPSQITGRLDRLNVAQATHQNMLRRI